MGYRVDDDAFSSSLVAWRAFRCFLVALCKGISSVVQSSTSGVQRTLILRERRLLEHKDATRLSTNNRTGFFGDTRISTVTGLNLLTLCLPGCGAMFKLNKKDLSSFGKSMSPFISTVYLAFDSRWDRVCAIEFTCPSVPPLNSDDVHADAVQQAASYMKSIQATDVIYNETLSSA